MWSSKSRFVLGFRKPQEREILHVRRQNCHMVYQTPLFLAFSSHLGFIWFPGFPYQTQKKKTSVCTPPLPPLLPPSSYCFPPLLILSPYLFKFRQKVCLFFGPFGHVK